MNNDELNNKLLEIIEETNFLEMLLKAKSFEKEYKTSSFYKETKISLFELIKNYKMWNLVNGKDLQKKVQNFIDGLNFNNINDLINNFANTLEAENNNALDILKEFKDIIQ